MKEKREGRGISVTVCTLKIPVEFLIGHTRRDEYKDV